MGFSKRRTLLRKKYSSVPSKRAPVWKTVRFLTGPGETEQRFAQPQCTGLRAGAATCRSTMRLRSHDVRAPHSARD
jgi:hypothetical protein